MDLGILGLSPMVAADHADHQVDQLVKIGHREQDRQEEVEGLHQLNHIHVNHLLNIIVYRLRTRLNVLGLIHHSTLLKYYKIVS